MKVEYAPFVLEYDWKWCNAQVGIIRCEDTSGIIAYDTETDRRVGAVIMDNWTANSVQCHFMLTTPMVLKHHFLECCFEYIFTVCNVSRVYGLVPANNKKAIKFNKHIGFTVKTVMEEAYAVGVDYILMELKREDCLHIPRILEVA